MASLDLILFLLLSTAMEMMIAAVINVTAKMPPTVPRAVETLLELLASSCAAVSVGPIVGAVEEILESSRIRGAFAVGVEKAFAVGVEGAFVDVEVAVVEEAKKFSV